MQQDGTGIIGVAADPFFTLNQEEHFTLYSAEVQQIWQHESHSLVVGGRYQTGTFETLSALGASTPTLPRAP